MLSFGHSLLEKSARLKQAKEEAEKEIAEYRAKLESEFQKKVSDVSLYSLINTTVRLLLYLFVRCDVFSNLCSCFSINTE